LLTDFIDSTASPIEIDMKVIAGRETSSIPSFKLKFDDFVDIRASPSLFRKL